MQLVQGFVTLFFAAMIVDPPAPPGITIVPRPAPAKWVELKVPAKQHVTLSAGENAKGAKWVLIDAANADLTPSGAVATFSAAVPGRYRVIAFLDGADPMLTMLVVGDAPNPPPNPDPNPPPPPAPDSPLKKKLRAAFDADAVELAAKRESAKDLAALYKEAAKLAMNPDVVTSGELLRRVKEASAAITANELVGVRRVVAEELVMIFTDDAELTTEQRKAASELFGQLAVMLESF